MNQVSKKFPLLIYFPGRCVIKASVYPTSTIADLKRITPYESATFLFNGQLLSENLSFEFYGIKPRDVLVIIQSSQPSDSSRWLSLTRDTDSFTDRISSIINQKTSREAARIRDFQLVRMERKPRTFRKLCFAKMSRIGEITTQCNNIPTNTSYQKPDMPSTEALPSFWDYPAPTPQSNCHKSPLTMTFTNDTDEGSLKLQT